ncbi:serine/threonine-protein kinase/endoribonuclease IRE1 isoform X2 [Phymastichus coffea]|uniref:serine/threonine-protein kinase/endoribonuclease IRE1 isoform X2 n=1 Tax=Phymastichus coffea TaxID=108790 RepID=UPI00273AC779|nr:serine/threonine-protein kinase/endoribonuclease IRE1 isoform X2 [Phymastichus coffea]
MPASKIKMSRLLYHTFFSFICCTLGQQATESPSTGLIPDQEDALLMFSTLDGSLIAVEQRTGEIRWHQNDEPAVKVPRESLQSSGPLFLPGPIDGSLYLFGPETEDLKKLPFTIPQLVATSPCRSSDGILYTGRKIDTWFSVDPLTGRREQLLGFTKAENTCPVDTKNAIFVGRTEYNIIMIDSKHKDKKWNVTFYDYSAIKMDPQNAENYGLAHFTASSSGQVVTLDSEGNILYDIDLGSPVIAVYAISKDGLITVPFTSVAESTINGLLKHIKVNPKELKFFPSLYIGEHSHGLYALPSLVDASTPTISSKVGSLLLEGPLTSQLQKNDSPPPPFDSDNEDTSFQMVLVPAEYQPHNQPLQITGRSDPIIPNNENISNASKNIDVTIGDLQSGKAFYDKEWREMISTTYIVCKNFINQQENKGLKLGLIVLSGIVIGMGFYFHHLFKSQFKEMQQMSQHFDYQGSRDSSRSGSNGRNGVIYNPEELEGGLVRVGKITFNAEEVLGKGCDGTFVYKGEFDGRSVAVKRLLPGCFDFADREVALLRESDAHANVVRYFCTEQDRLFRYIALELAEATLQDYVAGRYDRSKILAKNILKQAISGLAHLHSLDIVHRDIKPHNVLLSTPGPRGEVRAMISDFGLCKKLQLGRMSFSRRSGVTGTDGWIAPEMLNGERTTCAVDVFSMGCVFYYVLSNGKHPFGDPLRRQANILGGEIDLSSLQNISENDKQVALVLIKAMIASDPIDRPPAQAIHDHPMFWDAAQVLTFFQDVSDRVEKDGPGSPALRALETGNRMVVQGDWRLHIDIQVATDLRKYRSYRGESVRDLLRALRNKKHHYRELTAEAQQSLGEIPYKFTEYWLCRFPHLLIHSWCAMQDFRTEAAFRHYYDESYEFKMDRGNDSIEYEEDETTMLLQNEERHTVAPWRNPENNHHVDWSPNRARLRNQRRKRQDNDKKKGDSPVWTLPPAS